MEFEPGKKYAKPGADISDSLEGFEDAGYILKDNDLVIDIDHLDKKVIEKIINIFNIKTQTVWTTRGVHFYFKKPERFRRKQGVCTLGFEIEYKHCKNTQAVTIKRNGKVREIENEGVRESLPDIFICKKGYQNMLGFSEGESRNQTLFEHRAKIAGMKNWRSIIEFINSNVFDEPLPDAEMETLTRDLDLSGQDVEETVLADWLLEELDYTEYAGDFYMKEGDRYVDSADRIKRIVYSKCEGQKTAYVDEVIKQMQYKSKLISNDMVFKIRFKNGYVSDGKFVPIVTEDFTPYLIDINYNSNCERCEQVDKYLNHLTNNDENYKKLICEMLGFCLIVDPEYMRSLARFFIFIGGGGNGKGTLLQIIRSILGSKNVSGMSIKQLSDEKYLANLTGKLANLGDDLQDQAINDKDMKVLKNLSTCDMVTVRKLYRDPQDVVLTSSLIFTSNHKIKSWEKGESFKRRIMWLPMYSKVEKKDPHFIRNITSDKALEYWVKLMVEGYIRLYKNNSFTESKLVKEFNEEYHRENNPCLEFLGDFDKDMIEDKHTNVILREYEDWCNENDIKINKKILKDTVRELFGLEEKSVWDKNLKKSMRTFVTVSD